MYKYTLFALKVHVEIIKNKTCKHTYMSHIKITYKKVIKKNLNIHTCECLMFINLFYSTKSTQ